MAQNTYGSGSDQFANLKQKATDQFGSAADQAEDVADRVIEQGRQTTDSTQELAGKFKGSLNTSMQRQPMATLALAAIVGFVLGALWKS
jgi:ElaB/YqjD/DUF883 family membrane-anchored ribosome-binding protein